MKVITKPRSNLMGAKNCLSCIYYSECDDPKKGVLHVCRKYNPHNKTRDPLQELISTGENYSSIQKKEPDLLSPDNPDFDVHSLISSIVNDKSLVPVDIKINDSDMPKAPNFFTFATKDHFLGNIRPYVTQAIIATIVFSEYCPRCSDTEWLFEDHKVTDNLIKFQEKVALLENSVCPYCKATKSELVNSGELNFYQEMAVNAGQRCVTGDTMIITREGVFHIKELSSKQPYGFSPFITSIHNSIKLESTCAFYKSRPEKILKIKLKNGHYLKGTHDHPVMTVTGMVDLKDINIEDYIKIHTGQNTWGTDYLPINEFKEHFDQPVENIESVPLEIRRSPVEYIQVYLSYLFEHKGRVNSNQVLFYGNRLLTLQVSALLNNMGIIHRINHCKIVIVGKYIKLFANKIGFLSSQKTKEVDNLISNFRVKKKIYFYDIMPPYFTRQLAFLIKSACKNILVLKEFKNELIFKTPMEGKLGLNSFDCNLSRSKLISLCLRLLKYSTILPKAIIYKTKRLMYHLNDDTVYYSQVKSTEISNKKHTTYDFTLANSHLFWTNGLVSGNSGKSALVAMMAAYLTHRILKLQNPNEVYDLLKNNVLHGTFVALTYAQAKDTLWEPYYGYLLTSPWFCVAEDSVITMADGSVKYIKDVNIGDEVKTYEGSGIVNNVFNNGYKECLELNLENGSKLKATKEHKVQCLSPDGDSLIWKQVSELTENDYVVVNNKTKQSKIKSIVPSGKCRVYDLEISNNHNYFANNILVHNCDYHAMLTEYSHKYNEDLFKLKDTFVLYRTRRLLNYPAAPDRRTLRGRCLTGSTLINTNHGFIHLKELIKKEGQHPINDTIVDTHKGIFLISHTYKDVSETIKIKTKNGFTLQGTPEHPVLVVTNDLKYVWRRLDNLKCGDFIVSKTKLNSPLYGNSNISRDLATITGYMVANGYYNEISSDNPKVIERLYACFKRLTGCIPTSYGKSRERAETHYLSTGSVGKKKLFTRDYLQPLGYRASNSRDKQIPIAIRIAPKEILHEFLEAYFECDSGINGGSLNTNAPSEIEVGSASKKLATQLHIILFHNYNILGRLEKRVRYDVLNRETGEFNAKREYWLITITGNDAYRFLQNFKRAKVQKYADRIKELPDGYGSDRRSIPFIRKYLWDIYEDARLIDDSGKRLPRLILEDGSLHLNSVKPKCFAKLKGHVTKFPNTPEFLIYKDDWAILLPVIRRINSKKTKRLERFLKIKAHYEEVVGINRSDKKVPIYDITVPGSHAFTANCLVSHNTRIFSAIDEIAFFDAEADSKKVKMNANEVYISLERSLLTVRAKANKLIKQGFSDIPTAYFLNISSPASRRDKIMELVRKSQGSKKIYGATKATWDMNPTITREDLEEEFKNDPITAMRDYGAQPPLAANPFISSQSMVENCFRNKKNGIKMAFTNKKLKDGTVMRYGSALKIRQTKYPSCVAIDAGVSNNSFGIISGHMENDTVVIDIVAEVIPQPGIPLNFTAIYDELIQPIIVMQNGVYFTADRWNSIKLISDAVTNLEIQGKQYSLKYRDMFIVKSLLEEEKLKFPRPVMKMQDILEHSPSDYPRCFNHKSIEHLVLQMLTVQDTGTHVIKGDGKLTDDLFRSLALCCYMLTLEENKELFEYKAEKAPTLSVLGMTKGLSKIGGIGNTNTSNSGTSSSIGLGKSMKAYLSHRRK